MSESGENTRILNTESLDVLKRARDVELAKILKLRLILAQFRRLRTNMEKDDSEQVQSAIKLMSVRNYLRLNKENSGCVLNLNIVPDVSISYTERKAVRQCLVKKLQSTYQPIANFKVIMRAEFPELFLPSNSSSINNSVTSENTSQELSTYSTQLYELGSIRHNNSLALLEMNNRKCSLMKTAADLKAGPYQSQTLELICSELRISHSKGTLMRSHLIDSLLKCSDRSNEAYNEVQEFVNQYMDTIDE